MGVRICLLIDENLIDENITIMFIIISMSWRQHKSLNEAVVIRPPSQIKLSNKTKIIHKHFS